MTESKRRQPGFVRPHLVDSHGYTDHYAAVTALGQLNEEHGRLHEDDTSDHLDHEHDVRYAQRGGDRADRTTQR